MRTYILALVVLAAVLYGHIQGMNGLYMQISIYDIGMHIAGGVGIAVFLAALMRLHTPRLRHTWIYILVGVLIAGILWEGFEVYYDIAGHSYGTPLYWQDTIKDLIDDVIGGILVVGYMLFIHNEN